MGAPRLDHVVYAVPDLDAAIEDLERRSGVRAAYGGRHAELATHNALLGLGERRYLELLAPVDRESAAGLFRGMQEPRVYMWAVSTIDLHSLQSEAEERGYDIGHIEEMSRTVPDGPTLRWELTLGGADVYDSVVPFAIQWNEGGHPSDSAPKGCQLVALRGEHPEPDRAQEALAALGVELEVTVAAAPALVLTFDSPNGRVELR